MSNQSLADFRLSFCLLSVACSVALLCGTGCEGTKDPGAARGSSGTLMSQPAAAVRVAELPPFAGSRRCAECHAEIVERYCTHPMGNSAHLVTMETARQKVDGDVSFLAESGLTYSISWQDGQMLHAESVSGRDGRLQLLQAEPVHYAIGSGVRGFSYLTQHGETLYMSPLTWYAESSQWDLSPGYDSTGHPRFERRVSDGCITCHVGEIRQAGKQTDRFHEPAFAELPIACERCHGNAHGHIAFHAGDNRGIERDPIINPAVLEPAQRESVCYQCHLHGADRVVTSGRSEYTFQPGELLSENWTVFVHGDNDAHSHRAVSHVEQMRSSRCFQASNGSLGCVSCHDPHFKPEGDAVGAYFRKRCLNCHESGTTCSLPGNVRARKAAGDSCTVCHMPDYSASDVPHTAQTDHRILRKAAEADIAAVESDERDLQLFARDEFPVSNQQEKRARAIAQSYAAEQSGEADMLRLAEKIIDSALLEFPGDVPLIERQAVIMFAQGRIKEADAICGRLLSLSDESEPGLRTRLMIRLLQKEWADALKLCDRLLAIDAFSSLNCERRAFVLSRLKRPTEAISAAEAALEINPFLHNTRRALIEMLQQTGDQAAADKHVQLIQQLQ